MSIAISIKINDGLVMAADSAATLLGQNPQGIVAVMNTYNNANKVFNLVKGLPIGLVTWGAGGMGTASVSTLVKDLRRRLSRRDDGEQKNDWFVNPEDYTIESVAKSVRRFVYEETYLPAFSSWAQKPDFGCIVGGYSSRATMPDEYMIQITGGQCGPPNLLRKNPDTGATWGGVGEAINRLWLGYGTALPQLLVQSGVPAQTVQRIMSQIQATINIPMVSPAMPIQDAIDLAEFLVDLTIKWVRFIPGPPMVGGPVEIAAITKHEGFRWVKRKYYFRRELNPEGGTWETKLEA